MGCESGSNSGKGLAQNEASNGTNTPGRDDHSRETNLNMDEEYDSFITTLKNKQKDFIPSKKFRTVFSDPIWMNSRIKHLIGIKEGIYIGG